MNRKNQKFSNWSDIIEYDETSPSCLRWKVGRGNQIKARNLFPTRELARQFARLNGGTIQNNGPAAGKDRWEVV